MLNGHDGGDPNWDALGIFYMTFAAVWTLVIAAGLACLYLRRDNVAIRIRNFWLIVSSVVVLQLYLWAVLMVYVMNGLFTCGLEFWVMSTILPFGIALFQGERDPCPAASSWDGIVDMTSSFQRPVALLLRAAAVPGFHDHHRPEETAQVHAAGHSRVLEQPDDGAEDLCLHSCWFGRPGTPPHARLSLSSSV